MYAIAPGRVNLIGDHTDHTAGLALPMAIDLATTVSGTPGGREVRLVSDALPGEALVTLDLPEEVTGDGPLVGPLVETAWLQPPWARLVAAVVAEVRPSRGFCGRVSSTLPVGSGLSSSAALAVAVALVIGFDGTALELAKLCQRAERAASGVPCGVMDPLASAAGVAGHALLMDCGSGDVVPVRVPEGVDVMIIDSGQPRRLAESAYAERRRCCEAAAAALGPLARASLAAVDELADPVLRACARHVVTENDRVRRFAAALGAAALAAETCDAATPDGDALDVCGALMLASHRSLRDDLHVSTPALDRLVAELAGVPGVFGARLTGAGFGGSVVALARPGALTRGRRVRAAPGARLVEGAPG